MSKEDRMIELLEELVKWIKVANIPSVKQLLLDTLQKPEQKIAYHASDGKTTKEVAKVANVSNFTISKWWENWTKVGIAEAVSVRGGGKRAIRSFSLDDFGIEVPVTKETEEEKSVGGEET